VGVGSDVNSTEVEWLSFPVVLSRRLNDRLLVNERSVFLTEERDVFYSKLAHRLAGRQQPMEKLNGTVEYLYWSERRTDRFIEDNGLTWDSVSRTLATPSFSWLPTFSRTTSKVNDTRPKIASIIERYLDSTAVGSFDQPEEIQFAKGRGTMVFGEFRSAGKNGISRSQAVIFTPADYNDTDPGSVAVCLFGSMDNFLDRVQSAGPGYENEGWFSSAAPAVLNFIRTHGQQMGFPCETREEMALEALNIATSQGVYLAATECDYGTSKPWKRAYTYGDARNAEWLAQIYLDVSTEEVPEAREEYGFRRILVGAPLWIRTRRTRSVRIYSGSNNLRIRFDRYIQARRVNWLGSRLDTGHTAD
jgi:hypothetical protein